MQTVDLAELKLAAGQKVLDLGCGQGRHAHAVAMLSPANVIAVDINLQDVQRGRDALAEVAQPETYKKASWCAADGSSLPFPDDVFDVVMCSEVLEHIPAYQLILEEISRVLKPGGMLAVSVPRAWPERICWQLCNAYHQVEGGHIRIFDAIELKNSILGYDYVFIKRHWAHALHSPYWWLRCLFWSQGEDYAPVRLYHQFLVWDLLHKPKFVRSFERLLNPLLGKSVVMYFVRQANTTTEPSSPS